MESFSFKDAVITITSGTAVLILLSFKSYVIKTVSDLFTKKKIDIDPVVSALNVSKLIRDSLKNLLTEWEANRVYIIQFHNGGHFYTGTTMQKFSVTYEEQTPGVIPLCRILQNVQLSTNTYIKDVVENNYKINDTDEISDIISRTFYSEFHIKAAIGVPIYKGSLVIGAIILNYTDDVHQFAEQDLDLLSVQCINLHALLVE